MTVPRRQDRDLAVAKGRGHSGSELGLIDYKRLKLLRFFRKAAVASGLLGLGLAMTGCLVPQDFPIVPDDDPVFKNRLPVITSFVPTSQEITVERGRVLEFRINVRDEDLDDIVSVRWHVDWQGDSSPGLWREDALPSNGAADRPATLRGIICGSPLEPFGLHRLEAVVADGILINRVPQPKTTVPDAGENPSGMDIQVWLVRVEGGTCL